MKPDVKKIITDIKATKGNRKYCNGLAGTLQDDNYASSICKYVKTVTPERIDLLIDYVENLEVKALDMAVQLANADSKCRELAAENAHMQQVIGDVQTLYYESDGIVGYHPSGDIAKWDDVMPDLWSETPATDAFLAEVRAQGVEMFVAHCQKRHGEMLKTEPNEPVSNEAITDTRRAGEFALYFAAQLRKGVQS
ncbi:hypothetical protein [Citrobacter sp.]|uniref:hypothetical protein n=1 Tax=Citrobacter sp. TaxID=1896336 RepID=UPI003A87441C